MIGRGIFSALTTRATSIRSSSPYPVIGVDVRVLHSMQISSWNGSHNVTKEQLDRELMHGLSCGSKILPKVKNYSCEELCAQQEWKTKTAIERLSRYILECNY